MAEKSKNTAKKILEGINPGQKRGGKMTDAELEAHKRRKKAADEAKRRREKAKKTGRVSSVNYLNQAIG